MVPFLIQDRVVKNTVYHSWLEIIFFKLWTQTFSVNLCQCIHIQKSFMVFVLLVCTQSSGTHQKVQVLLFFENSVCVLSQPFLEHTKVQQSGDKVFEDTMCVCFVLIQIFVSFQTFSSHLVLYRVLWFYKLSTRPSWTLCTLFIDAL